MEKRFWAIIGVITVVFVGILWFSGKQEEKKAGPNAGQPTSHIKGNTNSKVTFVEYGDFQCPVCGGYYPTVSQVLEQYQDKVKFQFRHLPLSQAHRFAFAASRAAQAASEQGKFWEMYDQLFMNQQSWSQAPKPEEMFKQYASQIGLDATKYQADFSSEKTNRAINADIEAFKATGSALATPTFFLNGKKIELKQLTDSKGNPDIKQFSKLLDEALQKQD